MLHLLRNGRVYLWSPAVPVVAGLICDGVLHWSGSDQPSALAAPAGWQQPQASSCTLLPEAAALVDAAESQLLMGRGDPRTRRGKVTRLDAVALCRCHVMMQVTGHLRGAMHAGHRADYDCSYPLVVQIFKGSYGKVSCNQRTSDPVH